MSGEFYYFCSQLPSLRMDSPAPMTLAEFDALMQRVLPAGAVQAIASASYPPAPDAVLSAAYAGFCRWETALREAVGNYRIAQGNFAGFDIRMTESETAMLAEQAAAAAAAPNPMERQMRLDQMRFRKLDELASGNIFSLDAVICYRLKLSILERYCNMNPDTGRKNFESAVSSIDSNSAE